MELPSFLEAGFSLQSSYDGDAIVVSFSGNADMDAVRTLGVALKRLHEEGLRRAVREVVCDFTGLYFMNSSSFKAFVTWVTSVEGTDIRRRYKIRIRSNRQLHWQRRSLEALRCLAEKVVTIEQV